MRNRRRILTDGIFYAIIGIDEIILQEAFMRKIVGILFLAVILCFGGCVHYVPNNSETTDSAVEHPDEKQTAESRENGTESASEEVSRFPNEPDDGWTKLY